MEFLEKVLTKTLQEYLFIEEADLGMFIRFPDYSIKERVATIRDLQVIIYPNDHNPAHFHVKSKDKKIDAKFAIEDCRLISGKLSSTNLKRVEIFYRSPKGKIIMDLVWRKYHSY